MLEEVNQDPRGKVEDLNGLENLLKISPLKNIVVFHSQKRFIRILFLTHNNFILSYATGGWFDLMMEGWLIKQFKDLCQNRAKTN